MATGNDVAAELLPIVRVYKDGRVERYIQAGFVPPSLDPATGVASKDVVIDAETGVKARLYLPDLEAIGPSDKKLPVLVYYHGGGFVAESAFSPTYHPYLNSLVARAGVVGVSVEYRLAPEQPMPALYEDSWRALKWAVASGSDEWLAAHADMGRVFLAGDSAGGNIAHHMALRAGAGELGVRLAGVALVHPYFWSFKRIGSEAVERERFLSTAIVESVWRLVYEAVGEDDPRMNPLAEGAPCLAGLGCDRVLVAVAQKDLLRDRGLAYYHGLKASGYQGQVEEFFETEGEDHVFHLFNPGCDKAGEFLQRLADFLKN